jgi:hypothetical protein
MHASKCETLKSRVVHEFKQLAILSAYLAVFFCVMATYSMLLMGKFGISYFVYGAAVINAILVAKVILVGEAVHVGRRFEEKALLISASWKAFVFGWLVFVLHLSEEVLKHLFHHQSVAAAFRDVRLDDLLMRTIVIICAFVPLFLFRELRRVIGGENLRKVLFHASRSRVDSVVLRKKSATSEIPA